MLDGYGLPRFERAGLVALMVDCAVLSAANEAIEAKVMPQTSEVTPLWGITWRARSAGWLVKHRSLLQGVITAPA